MGGALGKKNLPLGPIYGVWNGKPIFSEIQVSVKQLQDGLSYVNLPALPGYRIDHVDFEYVPPSGQASFPAPALHLARVLRFTIRASDDLPPRHAQTGVEADQPIAKIRGVRAGCSKCTKYRYRRSAKMELTGWVERC
jgi:hypothetical protein